MSSGNVLIVNLSRSDTSVPWGFRMEGGADIAEPLKLAKVVEGSVAERAGLFAGDFVVAINDQSTHSMSHEAAKMEIIRSANEIAFTISRYRQPGIILRGGIPSNRPQNNAVSSARIIIPHNNAQRRPHSYHASRQQPQHASPTYASHQQPQHASPIYASHQQPQHATPTYGSRQQPQHVMPTYASPPQPPLSPRMASKPPSHTFNVAPQPFPASPPPVITKDPTGRVKKVAHNQYNSPMGLYSSGNVKSTLDNAIKVAEAPVPSTMPAKQGKTLYCHKCGDMIKGVFVRVHGQYPMHPSCLKCCKCGVGLQNAGYFYINDYLYCETHAKQVSRPAGADAGTFSTVYN